MEEITFRKAERKDLKLVIFFVKALAKHSNMEDKVNITEKEFERWMFDEKAANVIFLLKDGKEIGFALYLFLFSAFKCKPTLYLEYLYILEEHRSKGYGKKVFKELAKIAKDKDLSRIEWICLDNNEKGLVFYNSLGAKRLEDRRMLRLEDEKIDEFLNN